MKTATIVKSAAALMAAATLGFSLPATAGESLRNPVLGDAVAPSELAADAAEQVRRGNEAFNRGEYAEAFRLFRNVSVLPEPTVHYRLGLMYAEGLGTRKSQALAAYWLKVAVRENCPGAAEALAALKPVELPG